MKKILLCGRSECGKTTLRQALSGDVIEYNKTQYINNMDCIVDTPGEYTQSKYIGRALAIYAYECDVIGLVMAANEPYSVYPPAATATATRPVIGIITQIDAVNANPERAARWLHLAGCEEIFHVSSYNGDGLWQILQYLKEPGDVLPWETKEEAEKPRKVLSTKFDY